MGTTTTMFARAVSMVTFANDNERDIDGNPLIAVRTPFEEEITRITGRQPLRDPNRRPCYVSIQIANRTDKFWNYNIPPLARRDTIKLTSYKLVSFICIVCGIVTAVFMGLMINRIGMNGFVYTTPMYLILAASLGLKFAMITKLDHCAHLLFIAKREVQFIDAMTLLYIIVTAIPYDYFFSTGAREDSNHNNHSIWREKMVFIPFNAVASYFLVTYILVWLTSLLKERKRFQQNFYINDDGDAVRNPVQREPSATLLSLYFQNTQSYMKQYELIVALDVCLVVVYSCLLIFTFFRDETVGPIDTSMAFIMAYQFVIPFVEFCEINRIEKAVSSRYEFRNLQGSRYNNLTIYETNILVGVLASVVGVMIKVYRSSGPVLA